MTRHATPDEIADHERDLRKHERRLSDWSGQDFAFIMQRWHELRHLPPDQRLEIIEQEMEKPRRLNLAEKIVIGLHEEG